MRANRSNRLIVLPALLTLISAAIAAALIAHLNQSGDYHVSALAGADNAGPPLQAIVSGHFAHLLAVQPVMGLVSLLWRAPSVALANAVGGSDRVIYAAGAGACLLSAVALIAWMFGQARQPRELLGALVGALVILVGPATSDALTLGHPEEILTTVLATAAVLAARADRRLAAAILLGLAIGSKEWALLTTPAVLLALPAGRWRLVMLAAAVAAITTLPLPLLDPSAFHRADATIGPIRITNAFSLWWPLSPAHPMAVGDRVLRFGLTRTTAAGAMSAFVLGGLWVWGRRRRPSRATAGVGIDPLALLALIGLLRCLADPIDLGYYLVAAIVPLAVWEVLSLRRLPLAAVLSCAVAGSCVTGLSFISPAITDLGLPVRSDLFLLGGVGLGVYLAAHVFIARPPLDTVVAPVAPSFQMASAGNR